VGGLRCWKAREDGSLRLLGRVPVADRGSPVPVDSRLTTIKFYLECEARSREGACRSTIPIARQKFSRGAPLRGRCTPAIPARLRSERARKLGLPILLRFPLQLLFFATPQKLIPFDCRHDSNGTLFARFGALHAAQASYFYRACQRDFIRQCQQNLHRRSFFDVFG